MTFRSLASSSKGNAYIVSDSDTTLLLECGLPYKELEEKTGYSMASITACFITHEHKDHCRAASQLLRNGIPVYASMGTARALLLMDIEIIEPWEPVQIGQLRIMAFPVTHDTAQPVGYLIDDLRTHERLFFATDTCGLGYIVAHPTYIAVECNYEESLLAKIEKWPERVKERVRRTHFEIHNTLKWLKKQDLSGVLTIWLLHSSAGNSLATEWESWFKNELPGIDIHVCPE